MTGTKVRRRAYASPYDEAFYREEEAVAICAARIVLPWVLDYTNSRTVADVGCGTGAWLKVAKDLGAVVHGFDQYDGPLLIDAAEYTRKNLTEGIDCSGYDLVICLEVAEHLDEKYAKPLVSGLCQGGHVLFSAAIPGQGGVHHVNEQWGTYWSNLFGHYGYAGTSDLKWRYWENQKIADFYRQNFLLFAPTARPGRTPVIDVVHPERLGNWP